MVIRSYEDNLYITCLIQSYLEYARCENKTILWLCESFKMSIFICPMGIKDLLSIEMINSSFDKDNRSSLLYEQITSRT